MNIHKKLVGLFGFYKPKQVHNTCQILQVGQKNPQVPATSKVRGLFCQAPPNFFFSSLPLLYSNHICFVKESKKIKKKKSTRLMKIGLAATDQLSITGYRMSLNSPLMLRL
jgi:hypothetical protein